MVNDLPQVKATIFMKKLKAVQEASKNVEEWIRTVKQNIGYCEESPKMAALGSHDALTASEELCKAAHELLEKVKGIGCD